MTVLHLVRHGQTNAPPGVLSGRRPGVALHADGRQQIGRLAERLAREPIDRIYSSPLERTRETAEILAARLGPEVLLAEELLELDFGTWTGKSFTELEQSDIWPRYNRFRSGTRTPGGEWMLETQLRAVRFMLRLVEEFPSEHLVLVSHGDVIRSALLYFLGMPIDLFLRIEVSLGSLSTVVLSPDHAQVLTLNWTPS